LNQKLFGTSGIRGIVNQDLTLNLAWQTGLAVATATNEGKIPRARKKNLECPNKTKEKAMRKIADALPSMFQRTIEFTDIDGARSTLTNGWILIRASATEPLIRVKIAAESIRETEKIMERCASLVEKVIKEIVS